MNVNEGEELVEEIAGIITEPLATYHPQLGFTYAHIDKETATKMARRFIARTLKAIVDGLPLPGEAGRLRPVGREGLQAEAHYLWAHGEAFRFIALRPEKASKLDGEAK